MSVIIAAPAEQQALARYYRWHARIYDATRWSFLFGRGRLIDELQAQPGFAPRRVLEIGCGTGRNLAELARRFPQAQLYGVDLSADMLDRARRRLLRFGDRVRLQQGAYQPSPAGQQYDLIIASYLLSMVGGGIDDLLAGVDHDLAPQGRFAVVDFRDSRWSWFRRWMGINHVHLDDRLLPQLQQKFRGVDGATRGAYAGFWRWFWFIGQRAVSGSAGRL
jgi:S-adenosylmethionine-diacylgycerolhomoserine-N-methlytransferase